MSFNLSFKLLRPKTEMLEKSVEERGKNIQSREGEGHVNVGTNSQDYEVQGSNLDQSTQASVVEIESFSVDQLY
jgi:hypothetical protein